MDETKILQLKQKAQELIAQGKVKIPSLDYDNLDVVVEKLLIYQAELEAQNQELLETHEALEFSQKKFADLFNFAPVIYLILDKQYNILQSNKKAFIDLFLNDNWAKKNFFSFIPKGNIHKFLDWITKEGENSLEIELIGKYGVFWGKLEKQNYYEYNNEEILLTISDITVEKELSEKLNLVLKDQADTITQQDKLLQQSEKSALMGNMINTILHQWKQPLNAISLTCMRAENKLEKNAFPNLMQSDINRVKEQIAYMASTADAFRTYFNPNIISTTFTLESVCENVQILLSHRIHLESIQMDIVVDNVRIEGLESDFMQVLLNILNNSFDAFGEYVSSNKKITIRTFLQENKCVFQIKDNGGGIDSTLLPHKIFQEYITTKKEKGTGLGMYISKKIIEDKFYGTIEAYNMENYAIFDIILPIEKKETQNEK